MKKIELRSFTFLLPLFSCTSLNFMYLRTYSVNCVQFSQSSLKKWLKLRRHLLHLRLCSQYLELIFAQFLKFKNPCEIA